MRGDSSIHSAITTLMEARRRALLTGDAASLESLLHSDFSYIDSLGRRLSREAYLESRRSGEITFARHDVSDMEIRTPGDGRAAVVITCVVHDAGTFLGDPFEARSRAVHVVVPDGGRWVFLFGQSTAIAE